MTHLFLTLAMMFPSFAMAAEKSEQPEAVEIPLNKIWAYQMPGTRDIRQLEKDRPPNYAYGPLIQEIRKALPSTPRGGKGARACFAVVGDGLEALREAHAVLVKNKKPRETFPSDKVLSVVFFSRPAGSYVHLHKITTHGNEVKVRFRFVPHETKEVTDHIALIPLTGLPEGKVSIEIIQSPMDESLRDLGFRPISAEDARRIVCQGCSFNIVRDRKN